RPDVRGELPGLLVGQARAERGHALRAAVEDAVAYRLDAAAVAPTRVHQRGRDAAAAVRVAAAAIEPAEQPPALADVERVLLVVRADRGQLIRRRGGVRRPGIGRGGAGARVGLGGARVLAALARASP